MKYYSTKTFGNDRGLSCAFRQWRATSHCNQVHGYSLGFRFIFEADTLDDRNWVYDFGNTKWIKVYLEEAFDHTTAVAADDPHLNLFRAMDDAGVLTLRIFSAVGCEKFAEIVIQILLHKWQMKHKTESDLRVSKCLNMVAIQPSTKDKSCQGK